MRRDPSRPKCADIPDLEMLTAVYDAAANSVHPSDYFPSMPPKLVVQKLRKLQGRGLVQVGQSGYVLTQAGREALLG